MSDYFYCSELSKKKHLVVVTPRELRWILEGFHHVVTNTGVKRDYIETDPNVFFDAYEVLYQKLKSGARFNWKADYELVSLRTGITDHLENCVYQPTNRLSVPSFYEPCVDMDIFCFLYYEGKLWTCYGTEQFPQNVCGVRLKFPPKVYFEPNNPKYPEGFVEQKKLDDYSTYETIVNRMKSITKPLKLEFDGKLFRPSVRISTEAQKDMENFFFIRSNNITIL